MNTVTELEQLIREAYLDSGKVDEYLLEMLVEELTRLKGLAVSDENCDSMCGEAKLLGGQEIGTV